MNGPRVVSAVILTDTMKLVIEASSNGFSPLNKFRSVQLIAIPERRKSSQPGKYQDFSKIVKDKTAPLANSVVKMVNEKNCVACRLCEDVCQKDAINVVYPDGSPFVPEGRPDYEPSAA